MGDKSKIIVFFSTTKSVQLFSEFLNQAAHQVLPTGRKTRVYEMHSKRDMDRRMSISKNFRNDTSGAAILVTSDVSARGVDYPGVSRVIQMGVPSNGDMYVHRIGRTGRGDNKTGRGDLVLCSWEMGFVKRQLRTMPLKPLTVSVLQEQTRELAIAKDTETAAPGKEPIYSRRLADIEHIGQSIATSVDQGTAHETFMAQVGFYLGRISEMGLNKDEVVSGLQAWTQEIFGLTKPPIIPHTAQMRLGLLGNENRSFSRGMSSYGSNSRAPWEGRGSQSARSSSYGQRSSGYGSTSSYGSRGSNSNYTPRASEFASQYGSRDRSSREYGSRDGLGHEYGSRDRPSHGYGSRDREYGSRDGSSHRYGGGGSSSSRGSGSR